MAKRKDWPKWHHIVGVILYASILFGLGLVISTIVKIVFF